MSVWLGEMREGEINSRMKAIKVFFSESDHIKGICKKEELPRLEDERLFFLAPWHCVPLSILCVFCERNIEHLILANSLRID